MNKYGVWVFKGDRVQHFDEWPYDLTPETYLYEDMDTTDSQRWYMRTRSRHGWMETVRVPTKHAPAIYRTKLLLLPSNK